MNAWFAQYKVGLIVATLAVLMLLAGAVGWGINGWRLASQVAEAKTETANERSAHQADLATISNAAAQQVREALAKQQDAQQKVADLDRKHTEELTNANAENDRLRARLATGGRVRVAGSCPAAARAVPATGTSASAARVDDAATVELSPEAGRNVLDIRAGIIADQAALSALQLYVRTVCLAPR